MTAVVDASSVVAYFAGEASSAEREALLDGAHAPAFVDVEVTSTLRGLVRGRGLALERADAARGELTELPLRRHPDAALLARAWELRDICTTYDALYVALAEALDARLLTRDGRLRRSAGRLVEIVVGD